MGSEQKMLGGRELDADIPALEDLSRPKEDSPPEAGIQRLGMDKPPRIKTIRDSEMDAGEVATSQPAEKVLPQLFTETTHRLSQVGENLGRTVTRQMELGRTAETLFAALASAVARLEPMQAT